MALTGGDVIQFKEILNSSVEVYLNKLSNFVSEHQQREALMKKK